MKEREVEVAIIGSGSAGLYALGKVKPSGKSFVLINGGEAGTTCARVGCMPSKAIIQVAEDYHRRAIFDRYGIEGHGGAIDVAPAQLQSFLNPALHLPVYLLFRYAGPAVLIAVVGAVQAAQAVLLYLVADEVTNGRFRKGAALLLVAALVAAPLETLRRDPDLLGLLLGRLARLAIALRG